jgi:hypothetical protein
MTDIERATAYLETAIVELEAGIAVYKGMLKDEFIEQKRHFEIALSALHAQQNGRWIPVSNRLPEYLDENTLTGRWSSEVMFCTESEMYIGFLSEKYNEWMSKEETITFKRDEVTHWRSLPELPKEEQP